MKTGITYVGRKPDLVLFLFVSSALCFGFKQDIFYHLKHL